MVILTVIFGAIAVAGWALYFAKSNECDRYYGRIGYAEGAANAYRIKAERLEREIALYGSVVKKPAEPEPSHEDID